VINGHNGYYIVWKRVTISVWRNTQWSPACQYVYMSTCLHVYMSTCLHVYMSTCLHVYMSTCLHVYMSPQPPCAVCRVPCAVCRVPCAPCGSKQVVSVTCQVFPVNCKYYSYSVLLSAIPIAYAYLPTCLPHVHADLNRGFQPYHYHLHLLVITKQIFTSFILNAIKNRIPPKNVYVFKFFC
jgi:hypothetical protein